ncbi:unnamed protein product [Owenia fusiformis]|uniref:Glucosylceramidase n=1 Tax=Owenia fusiformis TaxID=6347 RepID=A0A8S4NHG7_OWEFU|nr:unnamed protein product [Owenia fusiformis]
MSFRISEALKDASLNWYQAYKRKDRQKKNSKLQIENRDAFWVSDLGIEGYKWVKCSGIAGLLKKGKCEKIVIVEKRFDVWLTTGDESKKLSREASIVANSEQTNGFSVNVNPATRYQTMDGFGAAITNAAAYNIYSSPQRSQIINDLFGKDGIGISYIRLTMGGSDFQAVEPYTYNDMPSCHNDTALANFSIAKDHQFIIPVLQGALRENPTLKIMATPWSAPAWMKNNCSLNGGFLREDYMNVYADYFLKFVQAYADEGITINAITVQNEPLHESQDYPSMYMWWQQQSTFIKDHLGPRLSSTSTKIIAYDHNWDDTAFTTGILSDSDTNAFVDGSAWHCYSNPAEDYYKKPGDIRNQFPNKNIYFTECTGGDWSTDFGNNIRWNARYLFIGQPRNGAKTVLLWNMALDEDHGPKVGVGGCSDCRGVVTVDQTSYQREVEYYLIGHFSKFVPTGSVRIDSSNFGWDDVHTVAFEAPDGAIVAVVLNPSSTNTVNFNLNLSGSTYQYNNLPPKSVVTLKMSP